MKLSELKEFLENVDPDNLDPEVKMVVDSSSYEIKHVSKASDMTPEVYLWWA